MKKSGVGESKKMAWLFLMLLAWSASPARADSRRAWFFEQLGVPPAPTYSEDHRHQVGLATASYADALTSQLAAVADLRLVELRVRVGQRMFLQLGPAGVTLGQNLAGDSRHFGLEIARYRANPSGLYGRIAFGVVPFQPQGTAFWQMGFSSGVLPTAAMPWDLRLSVNVFLSFDRSVDYLIGSIQTSRRYLAGTAELSVGGFVGWNQSVRATTVGEHIMLSLGPKVAIKGPGWGQFSLGMPLRIWIDHALTAGQFGFLTDFSTPALSAEWTLFL